MPLNVVEVTLAELFARYSPEELAAAANEDSTIASWLATVQFEVGGRPTGWHGFVPREDRPAEFDQQSGFCNSRDAVSFLIGGNAAGTTEAASYKAARFMLYDQAPPRKDTPFWIMSHTYEQTCDVIWKEKMLGHNHIPACEVQWDRISWRDQKRNHPAIVPLLPWPQQRSDRNWAIHFKSYEQGREALQAASIGGFFFSEQFPADILLETIRGCREYMFPGGQFAEFTPIDPELCIWIEAVQEKPPPGWGFYRCNTYHNRKNLAEGWYDSFFGAVSDEMMQTRLTGQLATYEGAIYPSFVTEVHVRDFAIGEGWTHSLGTDWGSSFEHPFVTIFGAQDGMGCWWIYDEYWTNSQSATLDDKARAVIARAQNWGWPTAEARNQYGQFYQRLMVKPPDAHSINGWGLNYADPSRTDCIRDSCGYGLPTVSARNSVDEGIDHVRSLMKVQGATGQPRIMIHPRCRHLIAELRKYRWERGKKPAPGILNPHVAKPQPLKRDDDSCDALRYLVYSKAQKASAVPSRAYLPQSERLAQIVSGIGLRDHRYGVQLGRRPGG